MKLKKIYRHDNKRQIWRILPAAENKVVIEERDSLSKEVFFSCFDLETGRGIFSGFQLDEKNWCGIEAVYRDVIFFHKYGKPDMPAHKSIIAFDIFSQSILWQNQSYVYSFVHGGKVYCYQQRFDSRLYFALDYLNGSIEEELDYDKFAEISERQKTERESDNKHYLFPEYFGRTADSESSYAGYMRQVLTEKIVKGDISFLIFNNLLLFNYHELSDSNTLFNIFSAVDLSQNKILMKNTLDKNLVNLMPESFFVKDNFLFLIIDKVRLEVYQIIS